MKNYISKFLNYTKSLISRDTSEFAEFGDLGQFEYEELKSIIVDKYPNIIFKLISLNDIGSFFVTYETKNTFLSILYQNDGKLISASKKTKAI